MNSIYIQSVGVVGSGLPDWPTSKNVLTGQAPYQAMPIPRYNPEQLPANERRRITPTIRLALQVAEQTLAGQSFPTDQIATIFATSNGDLDISDRICNALTLPDKPVSPTDFHNSVHNAPAGYWCIANQCRQPSTSLSAGNASFAASVLEATTQTLVTGKPVMTVTYHHPPPEPLAMNRNDSMPFSAGLLIQRDQDDHSLGKLSLAPIDKQSAQTLECVALAALCSNNPAARALLLLELVAKNVSASCVLPYINSRGLRVEYTPC